MAKSEHGKSKKTLIDHINEQEAADKRVCLYEVEVCALIKRKRTTLWKLRGAGILKYDKDGTNTVYDKDSVYAYLRARAGKVVV